MSKYSIEQLKKVAKRNKLKAYITEDVVAFADDVRGLDEEKSNFKITSYEHKGSFFTVIGYVLPVNMMNLSEDCEIENVFGTVTIRFLVDDFEETENTVVMGDIFGEMLNVTIDLAFAFELLTLDASLLDEHNFDSEEVLKVIRGLTAPDLAWIYYSVAKTYREQKKESK